MGDEEYGNGSYLTSSPRCLLLNKIIQGRFQIETCFKMEIRGKKSILGG